MDTEHGLGNVTGEIMLATLLKHWVKFHCKPDVVRTDPEGAFRDQGFRRALAAKSIYLDVGPGDAPWKTRVLGKNFGYKQTASNSCCSKNSGQCHNCEISCVKCGCNMTVLRSGT